MSQDYESDQFERQDSVLSEKKHLLRLSIDMLSVKDLQTAANLTVSYTLALPEQQKTHGFKSSPPTAATRS